MPAESCLPPDSAVALEHPGFAELCKGTLLSVIYPLLLDYQVDRDPLVTFLVKSVSGDFFFLI